MDKLKLLLFFIILIAIIIGGLYRIAINAEKANSTRIERVNKDYAYGKGVILDKKSYKGHSLEIRYKVRDKEYIYTGAWDYDGKHLREGDSIAFRYSLDSPELIITEMENSY